MATHNFKNIEDVWAYVKNKISGAQIEPIKKSSQNSYFNMIIPRVLVRKWPAGVGHEDLSYTFTSTYGDIECFFENMNLSVDIYDTRDIFNNILKYLNINESMNAITESENQDRYHEFFEKKLSDYGVSSPSELSREDKSKFFSEIKSEWKSQKTNESLNEAKKNSFSYLIMNLCTGADVLEFINKYFSKSIHSKSKNVTFDVCLDLYYKKLWKDKQYGTIDEICSVLNIKRDAIINESDSSMVGVGKVFNTLGEIGVLSSDALEQALGAISDTMAELSNITDADAIVAYKECESKYNEIESELNSRLGL